MAVDSYGGVYRNGNGNFAQLVGPIPSFQEAGNSGFRSVMIAPDGVIYGIHALNQWNVLLRQECVRRFSGPV